jgi:4-amino-4-deoxy-L-arabinose transferase-like glycosyltransferase
MRYVWAPLVLALLVGRIVATYGIFNDVIDESIHVAAGLEVLQKGTYTVDDFHPPVARVILAVLPYYGAGLRVNEGGSLWGTGMWGSGSDEVYWKSLALARAGNLIFAVLAVLVAGRWAGDLFGVWAGRAAMLLAACGPNLLAHASLATVDAAAAATIVTASYCFWRWTRRPGWRWCAISAGAFSLAALCKFSALFYLPAIGFLYLLLALRERGAPVWKLAAAQALLFATIVWFAVQAAHLFPVRIGEWIPSKFASGVRAVLQDNRSGHGGYVLGRFSDRGAWYYFPVAVAVKNTIPLLGLAAIGIGLGATRRYAGDGAAVVYPLAAMGAVLAVAMTSHINIGIRHVLKLEPLLAIVAAGVFAARPQLPRPPRFLLAAGLVLAGWHVWESAAAHPDYLPYFNQIARGREEYFLIDSNLDWGQDLARLARYVREHHIAEPLPLRYFGLTPPARVGLRTVRFNPEHPPPGWSAISVQRAVELLASPDRGQWLKTHPPTVRIGKSIWLYYLPESS